MTRRVSSIYSVTLLGNALRGAISKLMPTLQLRNPVMFVVYIGAILTTVLGLQAFVYGGVESPLFVLHVSLWLWLTVIFGNFAEALAEGRGQAHAGTLRSARDEAHARRFTNYSENGELEAVPASSLRRGDLVRVEAGEIIPSDGEVIEGAASVDESAITGESAPVIRQAGGDKSAVTGGTKLLSDWLIIRMSVEPSETFLERMIAMVENARRQKTPNEIALTILLVALTIVFLLVSATLLPFSLASVAFNGTGQVVSLTVLVALLVCLAPTTIGALVSTIGIAGMDRLLRKNIIALSGRAVEAAGDIDVLLLDKTGTITLGNRHAVALIPAPGVSEHELSEAAQLASMTDETPEGRSIMALSRRSFRLEESAFTSTGATFVPFSALTRMSGVDYQGRQIRKGAAESIFSFVTRLGGSVLSEVRDAVERISKSGGTPLVVAVDSRVLGIVHLKDVVKGGIRERFAELRQMGIKTIMVTGDSQLTAAAIAAEAGVDDFVAEATPETKLELIKHYQEGGKLVAMTGDGTNDAPALAQADVAVAMNSGTQAAKEAGNLIDLDSNPTKLIEIVETGKQLLMTRGALTTFSIANDVSKYFAIIPAAFASTYPCLSALNLMRLASPQSAILSAVIFNAFIILVLVPLALKGVRYTPCGAAEALRRNLLLYGGGGLVVPFIGIKLTDIVLVWCGVGV